MEKVMENVQQISQIGNFLEPQFYNMRPRV